MDSIYAHIYVDTFNMFQSFSICFQGFWSLFWTQEVSLAAVFLRASGEEFDTSKGKEGMKSSLGYPLVN